MMKLTQNGSRLKLALSSLVMACCLFSHNALAQRWFEIEVVLFKYTESEQTPELTEHFEPHITPLLVNRARDLIAKQLPPSIKPFKHLFNGCDDNLPSFEPIDLYEPFEKTAVEQLNDILFWQRQPTWQQSRITLPCFDDLPSEQFKYGKQLHDIESAIYWSSIPARLSPDMPDYSPRPYLIADRELRFRSQVKKFRWRKDIQTLLHFGWRQAVGSQERERPWRVYAGRNYSKQFDYYGEPVEQQAIEIDSQTELDDVLPEQEQQSLAHNQVMRNIDKVLGRIERGEWDTEAAQQQFNQERWQQQQKVAGTPKSVWEIDGLFKVYIKYNYLHIDAQFNYREPGLHPETLAAQKRLASQLGDTQQSYGEQSLNSLQLMQLNNAESTDEEIEEKPYLYAYHFDQTRRIRSTEIHYFDHPKMGMIVQVRKHIPVPPTKEPTK